MKWLPIAILLAGCTSPPVDLPVIDGMGTGHPLEGTPAPDYKAHDLNGSLVALSSLHGQPVLLHIWASWCHTCASEEATLHALYEEYGDHVAFVMVSIDAHRYEQAMRDDAAGEPYLHLWDPEDRIRPLFEVTYQPVTIFLDKDGTIDTVWQGQPKTADPRITLRAHPDEARATLERLTA